ncbi:DHH family phosphoesterase [Corynebacterium comes]|uniref:Bifunctional oligoribonuclease and PAP phosphatase NrnA n=1 Tax=Corynebacterium comes TaxID=2675218 RepID=A0A6B8W1S0_9CORY|nr:bifunctional oligoribonuclease/PAP phosphatase NrnA [Corynebacterium comes]QGU04866.1 Bifunctional oligoribonuclease and PAP phosphatase NrnA [Corynebacterium comes]
MPPYAEAAAAIEAAHSVAVIGHVRADADAIGSVCATVGALRQLGKQAVGLIGQSHPFADNLRTIPGAEEIALADSLPDVDLIITVDCGSLDRTGTLATAVSARAQDTVVIDHHASNPGFGRVDLIDVQAESTTTVLGRLFEHLGVTLDQPIAHALYAGVLTDTGSFRWGSPQMHTFAARLMETGLDVRSIAVDLLDSGTVVDLRMMGRALSSVEVHEAGDYRLAVIVADHDLIRTGSLPAVEGLVDFVRSLQGTNLGVVFKESLPDLWHVSLRSNQINVALLAVALGGGGHTPAAGYTAHGTIEEVLEELLGELRAS